MEITKEKVQELAAAYQEEVIAIRRHLHAHPELSFEEHDTSRFIQSKLDEYGLDHETGYVETGIVGHIHGEKEGDEVIALRADIDALPIRETNEVNYRSQNEGVMHACGHDVHTASLLGTLRILNDLKAHFGGTVKFLFQPGEERLPGGASLMIRDGALRSPEPASIIGQHVYPELEAGQVGFKSGKYMASTDELFVRVKGKGGHAALPHKNIDPVLITAHMITALQQLVSRNVNPELPCVLSFGKMTAEGATNIIPDVVELEGTFRTFDEDWREEAHGRMKHMAEKLAESMGGSCEFRIEKGYPYLVNDEETTERARKAAQEYLGEENVVELPLRMTAEDFAYYSQEVPGCFYRLGVGNEARNILSGLHTSSFDVDEEALRTGPGTMAWITLRSLGA